MTFTQAVASGFRNYVRFDGRAVRSEYWYWTLFAALVSIATEVIDDQTGVEIVGGLVGLALFLPGIGVSMRRLHDIDRSGWWVLLSFTVIGMIPLFIWACMRGTRGKNRYGVDPLEPVHDLF